MKKYSMLIIIFLLFAGCRTIRDFTYPKSQQGNGLFIYTYGPNNLRPPDTFAIKGLVTNVDSYEKLKYQGMFNLQVFDSAKNAIVSKNIKTRQIVYANIKSPDGKDSVEYDNRAGEIWRVVKRRKNITLLYRTFDYHFTDYQLDGSAYSSTSDVYEMILLKDLKKVKGVDISFRKGRLVKFINQRYNQEFTKSSFKGFDELTNYIMDRESERPMN